MADQPVKLNTKSSVNLADGPLDGDFIAAQVEKRRAARRAEMQAQIQQSLQGQQQQQNLPGFGGNFSGMC